MTSVPPSMGTASGRSALRASASSSVRGVMTSTRARLVRSPCNARPLAPPPRPAPRPPLAVAGGREPADLVIRGGRVFSAFTREWLEGDLAIADGAVAGLGEYDGEETLDAAGRYGLPGF